MEHIRVMLADDNPAIIDILCEFFAAKQDIEVVAAVSDGSQVVPAVLKHHPDIIILDVIMPRKDGFMALEELNRLSCTPPPRVIMLTGLSRDDFILRAFKLGASYYMVKPFDLELLYSRVAEIALDAQPSVAETPAVIENSPDEQITNLFLALGIPAHIKGYQYLREAVRMVMVRRDLINRITKELYPTIAHRFDSSPSKVERAMRHAIEVAWNRGHLEAANQLYGCRVFSSVERPTNGEFIALISDKISARQSA